MAFIATLVLGVELGIAVSVVASIVVVAAGLYAGRQRDNRLGMVNSRIGYRHTTQANTAFADGHAEPIEGRVFPRAAGGANVVVFEKRQDRMAQMMAIGANVTALYPYEEAVAREVADADLVVGAVLVTVSANPRRSLGY